MKNRITRTILLLLIVGLWGSCSLFDPDEQIPSYIHVESISFSATPAQGSSNQRITDAWIAVDDQLLGAFTLPATVPALNSGLSKVSIFPGVIENGISATRELYPFFTQLELMVELNPLEVDSFQFTSTYQPATQFVFVEDFEGSNLFGEDLDGNPSTTFSISSDDVFEGGASGRFSFFGDNAIGEVGTSLLFDLPEQNTPIFLELNFKNEIQFTVGVIGYFIDGSIERLAKLNLTPREDWGKVYVSLDQEVQSLNAASYQIYFAASKPNSTNSANIYLDNIKLTHF